MGKMSGREGRERKEGRERRKWREKWEDSRLFFLLEDFWGENVSNQDISAE